jgi:hypothetical protein
MTTTNSQWELQVRPHLTPYFAYAAAVIVAAGLIAVGFLLKMRSTGVYFHTTDQLAMGGLGVVLACVLLLFARPRLRAGKPGLLVRNVLGERLVEWPDVVDLPDDEYIPLMAIQAVDKERAVEAMDAVRDLMARYKPSTHGQ